ncbi:MAG TPA: class I SAM-dependent methyltransferase [Planctomycetaceae bacterium]|nr:class I SAM-dependent methyltransferase [Planctomycetaceae bacterium]
MEIIQGSIYDYPAYYDLVFGSDWKAEFDFFQACFRKHAARPVRRLFEPACGTGRLLIRFAKAGYDVCGLDLNPKAVDYCNRRFVRNGFEAPVFVGDMTDFRLPRKADAAFNPINSFRELQTEEQAEKHLQCMARCLARGGLYLLGLHLTPTVGPRCEEESWSARRGNLAVISYMQSTRLDRRHRREFIDVRFDVYTVTRRFRIQHQMIFRTYTARQMKRLLARIPALELVETYDFAYDINDPIVIGPATEDVVFVLRKR